MEKNNENLGERLAKIPRLTVFDKNVYNVRIRVDEPNFKGEVERR